MSLYFGSDFECASTSSDSTWCSDMMSATLNCVLPSMHTRHWDSATVPLLGLQIT